MRRAVCVTVCMLVVAISCAPKHTDSPGKDSDPDQATNRHSDARRGKKPISAGKQRPDVPPKLLTPELYAAGWIQLFDGQTLFGWTANSDMRWTVRNGEIHSGTGSPGLLLTRSRFADYELHLDFRLEHGGNSGVFLRTVPHPTDPAADCYELNICDTHRTFPTGSLVARRKAARTVHGEGAWEAYDVRVAGRRIVAKLNGETVVDFTDESPKPLRIGFIGLQMNGGRVAFRDIRLRPLGTRPLFNKVDLSGWRLVPGSKSKATVAEGSVHLAGGPGNLETESTWADFVLQAEVRTGNPNVNSGIFFRASRGTREAPANGYELQIHNGFAEGDRRRPNDYHSGFGSGAIFRRMKTRRIVGNDKEWMTMTLIADGNHFATWVNGYPTVDWTDRRRRNANPRRGRRLSAGHLSLQGHDATTDVRFRNLRLAVLPMTNSRKPAAGSSGKQTSSDN